jgi:ParB family chromosome partitioning protein
MKNQHVEQIRTDQIRTEIPISLSRQVSPVNKANIREAGIKKPITVLRRSEPDEDGKQFDLVCGHGLLQVFVAFGQATILAVIIEASREGMTQRPCTESADE